jgi:carbon storage regulator
MLVLSRREGESILIGDDIRIIVTSIHRGCIRIGIEAPVEVGICREELLLDPLPNPDTRGHGNRDIRPGRRGQGRIAESGGSQGRGADHPVRQNHAVAEGTQ